MPHNVLLATPLPATGMAELESADDLNLIIANGKLAEHLPQADALIVNEDFSVDAELIAKGSKLKLIGRVGASLMGVDLDEATRRGIIVMNTPGVDAITVAEYTLGMMLALVRNLVQAHHELQAGNFDYTAREGSQLFGKTLGIIGLGHVGRELAFRAIALGMNVLAVDPYVSESQVSDLRLKLIGLDELLAAADIVTLHTSVVPTTHQMINAEKIGLMRPGSLLINVKDCQLVDEQALLDALNSGHIGGAALDTYEDGSPLLGHPKVLMTQRMRHNTYEAQRDLSALIARQVIDALRGSDYRNAVNMPFMPGREYEAIRPKLELAEKIGHLLHYLGHQAPIQRVAIELSGASMEGLIKPLTVGVLRGLLRPRLGEQVNYINAPVLAAQRDIFVTQAKGLEVANYVNLLSCQVTWVDGGELVVAGSLFDDTEPRIIQVDRYRTDFSPEQTLLILGSYDVPGVIGKVGTFMATEHINIAGWRTSRREKGGHTLSIISIDTSLSDRQLDELRAHDFVRHATQIRFD